MKKLELFEAVRERLRYLEELGVEEISAEFESSTGDVARPADNLTSPAPDNIGDLMGELRVSASSSPKAAQGRQGNGDLLGSTKISEVQPKRNGKREPKPVAAEPKTMEPKAEQVNPLFVETLRRKSCATHLPKP